MYMCVFLYSYMHLQMNVYIWLKQTSQTYFQQVPSLDNPEVKLFRLFMLWPSCGTRTWGLSKDITYNCLGKTHLGMWIETHKWGMRLSSEILFRIVFWLGDLVGGEVQRERGQTDSDRHWELCECAMCAWGSWRVNAPVQESATPERAVSPLPALPYPQTAACTKPEACGRRGSRRRR